MIHILVPLSTQSEPSRLALVRMPDGFDPKSGSVSPKQPIASPAAICGSHCCFWSSEPQRQIANIASDPCTLTSDRMPESTASSSMQAKPVGDGAGAGAAVAVQVHAEHPELTELSRDLAWPAACPASNQSATCGRRWSVLNWPDGVADRPFLVGQQRLGRDQVERTDRHDGTPSRTAGVRRVRRRLDPIYHCTESLEVRAGVSRR